MPDRYEDGPSLTARIKGDGYDVQVCTDEPLTDEERAALHSFLQARVSGSHQDDRCPHGFPSGGWDCCRHDPSLDDLIGGHLMAGEFAAVDKYERIKGWRITEHELGPHPEVESCDETPICLHVYRLVTAKEGPDA